MAIGFNKTKGKARGNSFEQFEYKNGDNKVRMVGGVLPRYVYWIEGSNNKRIPIECLAFDRDEEAFLRKEKDYVEEYFPDLKCTWAYCILCIDPSDNSIKVLNLKRKLFEQIMVTAEDLGDPTDPDEGWMVHFKRTKTGPHAFNVEYQLQQLKCKKSPLTDEQKKMIGEYKSIDELIPRQTPESQLKFLQRLMKEKNEEAEPADESVEDEFDIKDDND